MSEHDITAINLFSYGCGLWEYYGGCRKAFISQPSLSAAIHNLEKEMGVTAFTRSNKGVTVTRRRRRAIVLCKDALRAG